MSVGLRLKPSGKSLDQKLAGPYILLAMNRQCLGNMNHSSPHDRQRTATVAAAAGVALKSPPPQVRHVVIATASSNRLPPVTTRPGG